MIPLKEFLIWAKYPGGFWRAKRFKEFFQDFYYFKLSKSAEIWRERKISGVYNILRGQQYKNLHFLLDFAKCSDSRIIIALRVPKIEGGGVSQGLLNKTDLMSKLTFCWELKIYNYPVCRFCKRLRCLCLLQNLLSIIKML